MSNVLNMSRDRFQDLSRHIRFDDKSNRSIHKARDKLAPIRNILDEVNKNSVKH